MAAEVRVMRRDTGKYIIPVGDEFLFPTNYDGIPYLVELINRDPYANADVEMHIDGEFIGKYRVCSEKTFKIERSSTERGGFSLFPSGTGIKAGRPENGKVKTVWHFDADHTSSALIKTSTGEFQQRVNSRTYDESDNTLSDALYSKHGIVIDSGARYGISRYCDDRGITYHTAPTRQTFREVKALEKTREPIIIEFTLIMPENKSDYAISNNNVSTKHEGYISKSCIDSP